MSLRGLSWVCALGVLSLRAPVAFADDATRWRLVDATADTATEKHVVRLTPKGDAAVGSNIGLALVEGVAFGEGTLEVDLKGSGPEAASFLGVAFAATDAKSFESIYFRPFNFTRDGVKDGQTYRSHAVQYVAWPDHPWEKLRKERPGVYESAIAPVPDPADWFHVRVEITKRNVSVWVDGAKKPCLVVERFVVRERGAVGLWVDSKEGAFRNLKISPAGRR